MAFLYLIDLVTSISLHIIVKCSSWIIYSSSNGLYYLYKKISPGSQITNKPENVTNVNIRNDDNEYVIITREEYNKLINNQNKLKKQ
jgi:hypothetical protein